MPPSSSDPKFGSHTDAVEFDQVAASGDRARSWGRIVGVMALLVGVAVAGGDGVEAAPVAASGSVCVVVPGGAAGDVAVVNITNTDAVGGGWGALRSSGRPAVYSRVVAERYSSVNYAAATPPNPNLAFVEIGFDGRVCYDSAVAASNVILDLAAIVPGANITAFDPVRLLDTRGATPAPVLRFDPGQYLVGGRLPAGRYEMNAGPGCYWERLSGLTGAFDDIIANDFQPFAGRIIVDIESGDLAFSFDDECGEMSTYVPSTARLTAISSGFHVVGEHIQPGDYQALVGPGCYWARLADFSGDFSSIITNDFISTSGPRLVTILPTDVGFYSDPECGVWQQF